MFNPIEASDSIKQTYIDYITTTFPIGDVHYRDLLRNALDSYGTIAKGPYLDVSGSYKAGRSIRDMVRDGLIPKSILTLEDGLDKNKELKTNRPLYSHQEQALIKAGAGSNLVVTTGTGSGKTECFLLPIIQSLLAEREAGTLDRSVRAIIIYPMNALANDQMERLRKIFATCPYIAFGLYNSNTRHEQNKALSDFRTLHGDYPLSNEVISREVMQKDPPHILITNYSMLEYMMLRPKDDAVFSGANLHYIVLDEAHIYRGATGMETALLLRRLRARISSPDYVQYILTSATLGDRDADSDIVLFANTLCGASFSPDCVIRSETICQPMLEYREFPLTLFEDLYSAQNPVTDTLEAYGADFAPDGDDGEKIYELMLRSRLFGSFRSETETPITVGQVAANLDISGEDLMHLITISSRAVKEGTSLVKARFHYFMRALEGAYISLAGKRELYLVRRENDTLENPIYECAVCKDCGRIAIMGVLNGTSLVQPENRFDKKTDYFLLKQSGESDFYDGEDDADESEQDTKSTDAYDYMICPICGVIEMESVMRKNTPCVHGIESYVKIRKARKRRNEEGEAACPACEFGGFRSFYLGMRQRQAL